MGIVFQRARLLTWKVWYDLRNSNTKPSKGLKWPQQKENAFNDLYLSNIKLMALI